MAVIREVEKAGGRGFQAIVRKRGHSLSRVHGTRAAARSWAGRVEAAIDTAGPDAPFDRTAWLPAALQMSDEARDAFYCHAGWTLGRAMEKWGREIAAKRKSARQLLHRVGQWQTHAFANTRLDRLTTEDVQTHVNARIAAGASGSTVRHDVMTLRAMYRDAARIWGVRGIGQPCDGVRLPRPASHRQRRLEDGHDDVQAEEDRLRAELAKGRNGAEIIDLLDLALESGLRRAELLGLRAGNVRTVRGVTRLEIPDSKNGEPRRVVLSGVAVCIVARRAEGLSSTARLFTVSDVVLRRAWDEARRTAGVEGLRWHDLRHEALSRMAAKGLTVGELQAQSGHKTAAILLRYVNARAQDIAGKLG